MFPQAQAASRPAFPAFPRPFPRQPQPAIARIGDAEDLAWLESAILLGSFAAGLPIAGALINLQLNLLFKGADSSELPDFWQKAQAWIEAYVQEAVADEIWNYVIEPKILAIGQSVVRVKDEQPADQDAAYAAIRLACDELRNTIAAAAANPTDGSECTKVLAHFATIAVVDLAAWQTVIQLDEALGKSSKVIADHRQDYQDALAFYGSSSVQHAIATGYWYWRNALVGSPVRYHGTDGDFYLAPDNFHTPPAQVPCGDTSGADAESARSQYVHDTVADAVTTWQSSIATILGAFQGKGEYADGAALCLGTTDYYTRWIGAVYPKAVAPAAAALGSIRGVDPRPHGAFLAKRPAGGAGPLCYGDVVTLEARNIPVYLSGVSATSRAMAVPSESPQADLQWTIESGLSSDFPPGLPILPNGYFRLKNLQTGKYLAWQWPINPEKLTQFYFSLIDQATGTPRTNTLFSRVLAD